MAQTITNGSTAVFHYLGRLENGEIFDGTKVDQPAVVVIGKGQVMPAIELALEGMQPGQTKKVRISASDGFGEYDKGLVTDYPRQRLPTDAEAKPGMIIEMHKDDGSKMLAKIVELRGDTVVLDFNHPLAGQTLYYEIQVVAVK